VPDARDASRSGPDPELMHLLRELTLRSGVTVHLVTGFDHELIDEWFDRVPAVLWAEHGLWRREAGGRRWRLTQWTASEWVDDVRQLMEQFVTSTPGAFVEARATALTWHFGRANAALGQSQAQTLAALLQDAADFLGYEVTVGAGLVEVRAAGLSLHRTVQKIIEMNQSHQVAFVGGAGDAAAIREALRAGDILVDFSVEAHPDPRGSRSLVRELVESLVPAPREAFPLQARLKSASDYIQAGLNAVVPTGIGTATPIQE
jgi:trehalose 6-phosphate synthase/phosphatase